MIAGLSSSSLALAQRTASAARATMDDMSRQIATGQRVSSVKDDGAAWARANAARANAHASEALSSSLAPIRAGLSAAVAIGETRTGTLSDMRGLALAATDASVSAASRQSLQNDFSQLRASYLAELAYGTYASSIGLRNTGGATWAPYSATIGVADLSWTSATDGSIASQTFGSALSVPGTDISTSAAATTTLGSVQSVENQILQRASELAGLERRIEAEADRHRARADLERSHAASLTDADLGRASAARGQAETRQQLALSTVRQAISAYGSYASGLLGNAQRTQRAVA